MPLTLEEGEEVIYVERVHQDDDRPLPEYQSEEAAAFDLAAYLPKNVLGGRWTILWPFQRKLIGTGFRFALPKGYQGDLSKGRSGLAYRKGVNMLAGLVDSDYRGEVSLLPQNTGFKPILVRHGDRLGQMVVSPAPQFKIEEITSITGSALAETTNRGEAGFGSTG